MMHSGSRPGTRRDLGKRNTMTLNRTLRRCAFGTLILSLTWVTAAGAPSIAGGVDASPQAVAAVAGGQENLALALCGIICQGDVPGAVATGTSATFKGDIYLTPGCTAAPSFDWDFGDGSAHSD